MAWKPNVNLSDLLWAYSVLPKFFADFFSIFKKIYLYNRATTNTMNCLEIAVSENIYRSLPLYLEKFAFWGPGTQEPRILKSH